MADATRTVTSAAELRDALADPVRRAITIAGTLADLPSLRLAPGQILAGAGRGATLRFAPGQDGLQLSTDNTVTDLRLVAEPHRQALLNDPAADGLGRIELARLHVTGNVRLLASGRVRTGHVHAADIHIAAADARGFTDRPQGYGVHVVAGVFTLWNMQPDPASRITAKLTGISAGRAGAPVHGSGVFVGGTPSGGSLAVTLLETGEIHNDGGIAPGSADQISGGVFTVRRRLRRPRP